MAVNFVKFERGTAAVYNRRKTAHNLDENTLYFIYDKANPEAGGLLYLGYTLIGGTGPNSNITELNDLDDVDLSVVQSLAGGMLLRYSSIHSKWEPVSISQALTDAGIDFSTSDGSNTNVYTGTLLEEETIVQALDRIANEKNEGDIAIVGGQPYVYDGSQWVSLTNSVLEDRVSDLENDIVTLQNQLQAIDGQIATMNHLSYEVLGINQTTADIDITAEDADKKVYLVPNADAELGSNNNYDEYMVVNGELEKLGSWGVDLSNYVTTSQLNTTVANLVTNSQLNTTLGDYVTSTQMETAIGELSDLYVTKTEFNTTVGDLASLASKLEKENFSIAGGLDELYDRLTWSDIQDENE